MKTHAIWKSFVFVLLLGSASVSSGQDFLPFVNDNFAGINQITLQPASIADSRFSTDINVVGVSSDITNDLFKFNSFSLGKLPWDYVDPHWWEENTEIAKANGEAKNAFINQQIMGPSFLVSIDHRQSIAFSMRFRSILNADNIDEPLARQIYYNTGDEEYWRQNYPGTDVNVTHHLFSEYGISYARELFNKDDHYMKAGGTIKLVQGLGAAYMSMSDYTYRFDPKSGDDEEAKLLTWTTNEAKMGVSDNWGEVDQGGRYEYNPQYKFIGKPAFGLDLGFVYEWRPDHEDYEYDMNGKTNLQRRDLNKYKLKVGVSVLDIGSVKYTKEYGSDFSTNNLLIDLDDENYDAPPYVEFANRIEEWAQGPNAALLTSNSEDFKVKLPTALSFQLDYSIDEHFYINATTFTAFGQSTSLDNRSHYLNTYSITPRYEHKWFGASAPVSYNQYSQVNVGLGLRLGFVYIGTKDLLGLIGITNHWGNEIHFSVKIPIFHKGPLPDLDGDAVSDDMDKCLTVPGIWDQQGCPDKDGDGVPDNEDLCPDDPGPKQYDGCPDTDGDGIIDKLDNCPTVAGLEEFYGCPDTDGDGIIDGDDRCPNTPGIAAFFGCPDTDGDGIPDNEDNCPTEPGPRENQGCPFADTDGDGVMDKDDRCPLTFGDPANFGCPILEEAEVVIINTAFANLEFETNKAVILPGSFASLNELASLLKRKPDWKIRIAGHTDSVGKDSYNMELSKGRAKSVANYLEGQGVEGERIVEEWYGETKPIADNSTAEGRAKNRRVEMEVIFE